MAQVPVEVEGNGNQFVRITSLNNNWSGLELFQGTRTRPNWRMFLETPRGDLVFKVNEADYFATPGASLIRMTADSLVGIGKQIPLSRLHISTGFNADLTNHGFIMLGRETLPNLVFDNDEIVARTNGIASTLHIQGHGGHTLMHSGAGNLGIGLPSFETPDSRLQIGVGESVNLADDGLFMLGKKNSDNLIADENEIQARSNGTRSDLFLQPFGGNTGVAERQGQPALASLHVFDGFESNFLGSHGYLMLGEEEGNNISMDTEDIMARFGGGAAPLYVQRYGGEVGIGMLNDLPVSKLHIQGGDEALVNANGYIQLGELNKQNLVMDNKQIQARDDGATSRLTLQHDGGDVVMVPLGVNNKVGIGTMSPEEKLHVVSTDWQTVFQNQGNSNKWYFGASDLGWAVAEDDLFVISSTGVSSSGIVFLDAGDQAMGIGTRHIPTGYKLAVDGNVIAEQVRVELSDGSGAWPDFVFDPNYNLMPLADLASYLKKNKHLPDVPSADEIALDGINLGEMDRVLLQKIEELTLHMIHLSEQNNELKKEVDKLKKRYDEN